MVNDAGEGQRQGLTNPRVAIRRGGFVGSLAAALMAAGAVQAQDQAADDRRISAEVEWFAYAMVQLDLQHKQAGDLVFADSAESSAPPNPCAALDKPTALCPCPPTPPWVMCP